MCYDTIGFKYCHSSIPAGQKYTLLRTTKRNDDRINLVLVYDMARRQYIDQIDLEQVKI